MKKFAAILAIAFAFVTSFPVGAQGGDPPIPEPPPAGTYVLDQLDWLSADQEATINRLAARLDQEGKAVINVATLTDCGSDKTLYRKSILQNWALGHPGKDNGLLILVCWYGGDPNLRSIEQEYGTGLGNLLSSQVTDQVASEQFVPSFRDNDPGTGLVSMVRVYDSMIANGDPGEVNQDPGNNGGSGIPFGFLGMLALVVISMFFRGNRNGQQGGYYGTPGGYYGGSDYGDSSGGGGGSGDGGGSSTGF